MFRVLGLCVMLAACRDAPSDATVRERLGPIVTADQPPLKEDPAAGKRSELQWRKHLQAEEVERKMFFDKNHATEHRALIKRIKDARERLDQPKTPADLQSTQAAVQSSLQDIQASIDSMDRWKSSSSLHGDYEALMKALGESYPAARLAAMSGNKDPLREARESFDTHVRAMNTWLTRVEKDEDEAFEEGEL